VCPSVNYCGKPEKILFRMRSCRDSPSRGGWHEFTEADHASYRIADAATHLADAARFSSLLEVHPVWPALSIIPHLNKTALALLIAYLLDPRFYIDPEDPDRSSPLNSFLGLRPHCQELAHTEVDDYESPELSRCRMVYACWHRCPESPRTASSFLWRTYLKNANCIGELNASKQLVSYLCRNWLDALYPKPPWGERLFVPEHFFKPGEVEWYREAMSSFAH
jgi:hypothetical protein